MVEIIIKIVASVVVGTVAGLSIVSIYSIGCRLAGCAIMARSRHGS